MTTDEIIAEVRKARTAPEYLEKITAGLEVWTLSGDGLPDVVLDEVLLASDAHKGSADEYRHRWLYLVGALWDYMNTTQKKKTIEFFRKVYPSLDDWRDAIVITDLLGQHGDEMNCFQLLEELPELATNVVARAVVPHGWGWVLRKEDKELQLKAKSNLERLVRDAAKEVRSEAKAILHKIKNSNIY